MSGDAHAQAGARLLEHNLQMMERGV